MKMFIDPRRNHENINKEFNNSFLLKFTVILANLLLVTGVFLMILFNRDYAMISILGFFLLNVVTIRELEDYNDFLGQKVSFLSDKTDYTSGEYKKHLEDQGFYYWANNLEEVK